MRRARAVLGWLVALLLLAGFVCCFLVAMTAIGQDPTCPLGFFLGRGR